MRRLLTFIFLGLYFVGACQSNPDGKRGNNWMFGWSQTVPGPYGATGFGINFNMNPPETFLKSNQMISLWCASGVMNDTAGNLLFYTNGMFVADRNGQVMPHGDSLSYSELYYQWYNGGQVIGSAVMSSVFILPKPDSPNLYYIIHQKPRPPYGGNGWMILGLQYSVVDMSMNAGMGDVIQKNVTLIDDTLVLGCLNACRHANGRDWWILVPVNKQAAYWRILLYPEGFEVMGKQYIGTAGSNTTREIGTSVYSLDGHLYARSRDTSNWGYFTRQIDIFDFDNTTGILSNIRQIHIKTTQVWPIALSPNGRFLYNSCDTNLYQYDLLASNISSTKQTVATWDGFLYGGSNRTSFGELQIAPDNKIYISTAGPFLHIINQPDVQGIGCIVTQRSFSLPNYNPSSIPLIPNFRLGSSAGINEPKPDQKYSFSISPNPATESMSIGLNFSNNRQPLILDVFNYLGEKMKSEILTPFQGLLNIDISSFAEGMYVAILKSEKGVVLASEKFVIKR